ncbi:hypothetical protein ABBQ32_003105 [Trebouxia sp. C0010 RCD-2024]
MQQAGIQAAWTHRSWILKNSAEVIPLIHAWNQIYSSRSTTLFSPPIIETYDFERLYTSIDTSDMQANIMQLVREIFGLQEHANHVGIKVSADRAALWLRQHELPASDGNRYSDREGGSFVIDIPTIEAWLSFLLHHMYVTFGGVLKQQVQGTPMGTNCASHLANFFLAMYELRFLRNLACIIRTVPEQEPLHQTARDILHAFVLTGRYIDDLLSLNNPYQHLLLYTHQHPFFPEIHGIYPSSLSVTCTSACSSAPYMDIFITSTPNRQHQHRLTTMLYDKREHPPLSALFIIRFPHISSNISDTAKYNIITSQFHRYRRIILWRKDFVHRLAALLRDLSSKQYDMERMQQQIRRLGHKHPRLYGDCTYTLITEVITELDGLNLVTHS